MYYSHVLQFDKELLTRNQQHQLFGYCLNTVSQADGVLLVSGGSWPPGCRGEQMLQAVALSVSM